MFSISRADNTDLDEESLSETSPIHSNNAPTVSSALPSLNLSLTSYILLY